MHPVPGCGHTPRMATNTRNGEFMGPDAADLARAHTREAIGALVDVIRDKGAKPAERVAAANALLDRGHGKATQTVEHKAERVLGKRLAALSDDALLEIIGRGAPPKKGTQPHGSCSGGPNPEFGADSANEGNNGSYADLAASDAHVLLPYRPSRFDDGNVIEGEVTPFEGPNGTTEEDGNPWD